MTLKCLLRWRWKVESRFESLCPFLRPWGWPEWGFLEARVCARRMTRSDKGDWDRSGKGLMGERPEHQRSSAIPQMEWGNQGFCVGGQGRTLAARLPCWKALGSWHRQEPPLQVKSLSQIVIPFMSVWLGRSAQWLSHKSAPVDVALT